MGIDQSGSDDTAGDELEDVLVRRQAALTTIRLITLPAVFTFPMVVGFGIAVADDTERGRVVPWIIAAAVATGFALLALAYAREQQRNDRVEHAVPALVVTATLLGAIWGSSTFLVDFGTPGSATVLLLLPLGASMLSIIVCAPLTWQFLACQIAIAVTAVTGLALDIRRESLAVIAAGTAWFLASILLHRMVHEGSEQAIRLRIRTDELVARLSDEREHLADLNARLQHQATHDPLTDLANRRGTLDALTQELAERDDDELVALIYLDLDHFKHVNDSHGHEGGDVLLQATAQRLRRVLPEGAIAGRLGGDELVVVLPRLAHRDEALEVAEHIARAIRQPFHLHGREVNATASVGLALAPIHAKGADGLIRYANAALHRAKSNGRARVELFDTGLQTAIESRTSAEFELRRALDQGEIVPFLQPELDAATSRVVGAEVLARWLRRDGTVLNAVAFVPTAREIGMLEQLQRSVLAQVSPVIRRLHTLGLPDAFRFRINMTSMLRDQVWTREVIDRMFHQVPPELMTVDVTEQLVSDHLTEAASALAALRAVGMKVGLDDFGRGGSSIMLLRRLPLDEVRIDQGLLENIGSSNADRAVVRAIVMLVSDLGLDITADGVETPTQADALLALGCKRQQGHLYAPALPPAAFERFVLDREVALNQPRDQTWSTDELTEPGEDDAG